MPRTRFAFVAAAAALCLVTPPAAADTYTAGLQSALRERGLYRGPVDGVAGPVTVGAIVRFQRRAGITVDGVPGPETRAALGRLGRPLFGKRLLQEGRVGWDVSVLQFLLRRAGLGVGHVDGRFGPATARAVVGFQLEMGLPADGIVGRATRAALLGRDGHAATTVAPADVAGLLDRYADRYGVPRSLVRAVAWQESGFQAHVVSSAGARGVMQVTPIAWDFVEDVLLGRTVPRTVEGNIRVGVLTLGHLLRTFSDERLAVAAYYQGARSVRKHGLLPETQAYVANVLALKGRV